MAEIGDIFAKRQQEYVDKHKKRRRRLLMLLAMAEGGRGNTGALAQIQLSGTQSLAENFASGGVVGALTVTGATGSPTYSIDSQDAGNKFAIDGTNLETQATLDYETATSHIVTISVSGMTPTPAPRTFNIGVSNVVENPTPGAFSFTDVTDAALSTLYVSNSITVTATDNPALVATVTGGEYERNGSGIWTTIAGPAVLGDTFKVRHTSSASNSTATNTVFDIGGVSDTFTTTTLAEVGGDEGPPLQFNDVNNSQLLSLLDDF